MVAPARTRDRLLRAAAQLFAAQGFAGTSVEDLGAACGVSGPAVYKHFPSKQAVLSRLLLDISEQLLAEARALVAEGEDPGPTLRALVDFHADFALAEADVIRVQDRDLASLEEADRSRVRRVQRTYVDLWVDQLRAIEPALAPDAARFRVLAVFGLLNSTPHAARALDGRRAATISPQLRDELVAMALRALHDGADDPRATMPARRRTAQPVGGRS